MGMKGACLCGQVQFHVHAEPTIGGHCHCTRCQRSSGGGSVTGFLVPPDSLHFEAGEDLMRAYTEEGFASRHFCSACGSQIYGSSDQFVVINAGCLERGTQITPQFHMMVDFKASWDVIADDLPQFGEYPPMG